MTCVYISTHTCIYSYIHTPSCIYKYIHIHTLHVYMGIFIYKHASMCIHTYATTHTLSLSHTHTPKACLYNQAYLQTQKTCQNKSKETNIYGKKNEKKTYKRALCLFCRTCKRQSKRECRRRESVDRIYENVHTYVFEKIPTNDISDLQIHRCIDLFSVVPASASYIYDKMRTNTY